MSDINPDLLPVRLEPTTTRFEADGHTFFVEFEAKLSIARNRWLEKFGIYANLGRDANAIRQEIMRAYQANNDSKPGDVAVILDNALKSVTDIIAKESPLLYIATLFINRQDEDRKSFDLEFAKQKIESWSRAGLESEFFFHWALSYLKISGQLLLTLMENSSMPNLPSLNLTPPNLSDQ